MDSLGHAASYMKVSHSGKPPYLDPSLLQLESCERVFVMRRQLTVPYLYVLLQLVPLGWAPERSQPNHRHKWKITAPHVLLA